MNIVLTDLIKEQATECLIMFGAGIAFALFYQTGSLISGRIPISKWIRPGVELLFWLAAALMFSQFLYYCAYGKLSLHTIAAFAAGVLLWMKWFCDIIMRNNGKGTRIRGLKKRNGKKEKKQSV